MDRKTVWLNNMIRYSFRLLSFLAPSLAAHLAYKIWFTSPRFKEPKREVAWRQQATLSTLTTATGNVQLYEWGKPDQPWVLLVHGWSGRGPQLGAFAEALSQQGYRVISFDAPGHGRSDGKSTTIFEIAAVVQQIIQQNSTPKALVTHSFGGMVTALAIRQYQLPVQRLVAISCPTVLQYLFDGFQQTLAISDNVMMRFRAKLTNEFGKDILSRLDADDNLRDWSGDLLVIHDEDDKAVPIRYGQQLSGVSDAQTLYTQGLGHRRILRDKQVIAAVTAFVQKET